MSDRDLKSLEALREWARIGLARYSHMRHAIANRGNVATLFDQVSAI